MKVAVVGCGRIGQTHAAAVCGLGGDTSLVFCDPDEKAARRAAASFGGRPAYATLDDCLAAERPDVVHVCTPPDTHADLAVRALSAGAAGPRHKPPPPSRAGTPSVGAAPRPRAGAPRVDHHLRLEA